MTFRISVPASSWVPAVHPPRTWWMQPMFCESGLKRVGPYRVTRTMASTVSACLATPFQIKGVNYSISSACSTSAHCIGNALELIQLGKQDILFAGGGEAEHWSLSAMFDAMGALSTKYNDNPGKASRAYDADRDGFVIAGGGGVLVVEELEHARSRGAKIYAEITDTAPPPMGTTWSPLPVRERSLRCMRWPWLPNRSIDYINAHGTSTPVGDIKETAAVKEMFGESIPAINSTKSLSGHSLGAAACRKIYSLLMMENDFICESANIENLDPEVEGLPIVRERRDDVTLNAIMSNSFGFGGTNATLVFERFEE